MCDSAPVKSEGNTGLFFPLSECMRIFQERAPVNGEGRAGPPGAVFMSGNEYFEMFMDPRGREALGLIEKRNNCVMKAEVRVEFVKGEGEGDPQKALSEFTALMQRWVRPPHSSVVPPGCPDPEELDTQGGMDKPEDVQLTQSSLDQREPSQSKDTMEVSSGGPLWVDVLEASSWTSQPTTAEVKMDINDPFCSGGITIEKSCWTLMTTSYSEDLLKVQQKFGVRFEAEHNVQQDKVRMRAAGGRNAALESHAVRALSHLYTRIVTSPFTSQQPGGATGFTEPDPPKNAPKRDHGEPLLSGQSGGNTVTKKAMVEAAAGGGDLTEDNCPICLDTFKEKRQLGCKHQFCSGCLEASINSMGPCCPVCKQVFGTIVGNQPRGRMTSFMNHKSLPGFPNCGTIVINYEIRAGIQTVNVQNIWKRFILLCFYLPLFSFDRKNTQTRGSGFTVFRERRICRTTKRAERCCGCCRRRSTRSWFSPLEYPEQRWQTTR